MEEERVRQRKTGSLNKQYIPTQSVGTNCGPAKPLTEHINLAGGLQKRDNRASHLSH